MNIRKATVDDLSRIAEIYVFNNRINYFPIFKDYAYSFGELQVITFVDNYLKKAEIIDQLYVYDEGIIKGFVQLNKTEICKLYVDPFFQNQGIGETFIMFIEKQHHVHFLWALEKNIRAISFYKQHGFQLTGKRKFEEGTTEYVVELKRYK